MWASDDTLVVNPNRNKGRGLVFRGRMLEVIAQYIEEYQRRGGTSEAMERALDK